MTPQQIAALAAELLSREWGNPIDGRDYELAVAVGLSLGGRADVTEADVRAAVAAHVAAYREAS